MGCHRRPGDAAGDPVDEDPCRRAGEPAEASVAPQRRPGRRAPARPGSGRVAPPSERTDLRVENGHEPVEVAGPRRGEEGVNDGPLAIEIDIGHPGPLDAAPRAARELAGRRGSADHRGDSVERHREDIVEHERDPFGRANESRTTNIASPTELPSRASCSGSTTRPGPTTRSGRCVSSDVSRRVVRERRMLRQTRRRPSSTRPAGCRHRWYRCG